MKEEKKDFIIKDRRIFSQEEPSPRKEEKPESGREERKPEKPAVEKKAPTQLPEINFQTFIFSLNASALVQLGMIEDPSTQKKEKNLQLAKQTIDMLSMLQEKTSGNLTREEEDLMKHILYDLRLRYVKEKE